MRNYITTYTKKHFDVLNPQEDEIDINDIAHALTMITRPEGTSASSTPWPSTVSAARWRRWREGTVTGWPWPAFSMTGVRLT